MKNRRYVLSIAILSSFAFAQGAKRKPVTSSIIQEEKGPIVSFTHTKDTVSFAASGERSFPGYEGLKNEKKLDDLLKKQAYVEILMYLWGEKDHSKRIAWLTTQAEKGHVICMLELSKELAALGTKKEESFIWFKVAMIRMSQDVLCCSDCSVAAAYEVFYSYYEQYWQKNDLITPDSTTPALKMIAEFIIQAHPKIEEKIKNWKHFPSPEWVSYHGITAFLPEATIKQPNLKPQSEWKKLRQQAVDSFKEEVEYFKSLIYSIYGK
jgi:hypothetical protein